MSEVGEDIAQMVFQRGGKGHVRLSVQLSLHLSGDICYQLQLVLHFRLLTAVTLVLVNHRTSHEHHHKGGTHTYSAYDSPKPQLSIFPSYLTNCQTLSENYLH